MIFLEIIVGALMAVILMHIGHTLGEEKADREIITKFNSLRGQLRNEIIEEIKREERDDSYSFIYVGTTLDEVKSLLTNMEKNIDIYDYVSVSMFNRLTGKASDPHYMDLGWISLEDAEIYDNERGYILELPKPINLNKLLKERIKNENI